MKIDFWVGYKSKSEGGLIYLRRRQCIFNAVNDEEHGECLDVVCMLKIGGRTLLERQLEVLKTMWRK